MGLQKGGIIRRIKKHKSIHKKYPQFKELHNAVHFCFNEIAKQNKWTAKDVNKALDEYFNIMDTQKKESNGEIAKHGGFGGLSYTTLIKYVHWMRRGLGWGVELMVGTFDTPCNTIISLIAIGTWCVVVYNMVNQVSPDEARHSLAQPVQYVIYNKLPELYTIEENVTEHMIDYVENNVSSRFQMLYSVADSTTIVNTIRTLFWESNLYNLFIVKPISCLLIPFIPSCNVNCIKKKSIKKRSNTKSKSKKRSSKSKKRSSKSKKGSSKSKKRSTKYYTPKEE
jgi:hypothetical protein